MLRRLQILIFAFCLSLAARAQDIQVSGKVVDAEFGEPLPGVNIRHKGTESGVVTNADGNYAITIHGAASATLVFTFVGMEDVERTVTGATKTLNVTMRDAAREMEEVVKIAYGTRKKGTLAGAVTTVKAEKIEAVPTAGFDQALQGNTPGLTVLSNSGEPSKAATFQIRGTNSINSGTAPLFILDGVPITSSDFNTINPADIESLNILKDASSTSIYGARAANGVVVITTKRGVSTERPKVTFSGQWGFSRIAQDNWNLMNTAERIAYEKELGLTAGKNYDKLSQTDINWANEVFNSSAPLQSYSLSLNHATDKVNYYVSANFFDQDGIAQSSKFKRYTLRANTEVRCSQRLQVGTNTMLTYEDVEQADDGQYTLFTPISACRFMLPYWSPYTKDGHLASSNDGTWKGQGANPIEYMDNNPVRNKKYKAIATLYADFNIYKGLSWRTQLGLDYTHSTAFMQSMPDYAINNSIGTAGRGSSHALNLTITNLLTYKTRIRTDHELTLMGGQEGVNYSSEGFQVVTRGQNNNFLTNVSNGTRASSWSDSSSSYSFLSFFARGEYNYLQRYYLEAALRTDASSRFGKNGRWATFASLGAMWNLRRETFMKDRLPWLTTAQVTFSTGTTGNSSIPNYDHLALVGGGATYDGSTGIYPMQSGNEDLSWEKVWATNLGIHVGFLNRITLDVELYNKSTTNMLMLVPVSYADKGEGSKWDNVGAMTNRGVEMSVAADLLRIGDFRWSVNANASYNYNNINELYNGVGEYEVSSTNLKLVVGHPVSEFYMVRYAGVNPANGDALWYTKDGAITNVYDEKDKVMLGKTFDAPWQGGFGTSLSWRGLTVSAHFSWVANRWMFNNDRFFEESNGLYTAYNQSRRLLYERWKQPGDVTEIPRHGVTPQMDTRFLEDASFLRLKNVMISYSLPSEWMRKTRVFSAARIYLQGQNLLTWTRFRGLDPEGSANNYAAQYPMSRQFTLGVDISF